MLCMLCCASQAQASATSNEYLDNAYIPKSAWVLIDQSPGLTLALLKDGGELLPAFLC
jgi:hypothetical protein